MQIQDFVPSGNWFIDCYHTLTSDDQVRIDNNGTIRFNINDILIVITRRPITYLSSFAFNPHVRYWKRGGVMRLAWNNPGQPIETEIGTLKTLICVPNTNDSQVDKKLKYAKSILSLKYGLTLTWAKLTQYNVDNNGGNPSSESPSYGEPLLMFEEDKSINDLIAVSDAITNELNKIEQSIAQIALSLFYDSVYSTQVYDQILKVWFAIEVLCKIPGEHKKQPIKDSLIKIYGDNRYDVFVDLLYQIRNAIVHDGYSGGVFGGVIGVGYSLFYDLFADYCKTTSPRKVEKAIDFYSLDIDKCKSDFQTAYDLFFK